MMLVVVGGPAVSTDSAHPHATRTVVVRPGETLWDIATTVAPRQDPRVVVADLVSLNSLPASGTIRVGQPILVPRY